MDRDGKDGWLTKFTERGKYQIYERLRSRLEGSLIEKAAKKFIENDGPKRYRVSTHPDLIIRDRENLLKHTDSGVLELVKKCRKRA